MNSQALQRKVALPFEKKLFPDENLQNALSLALYGVKARYGTSRKEVIVYLHERYQEQLSFLPLKENLPEKLDLLDLHELTNISTLTRKGTADSAKPNCLYLETSKKKHSLEFSSEIHRDSFHQAVQHTLENSLLLKKENMETDQTKQLALDLFSKADTDLSDSLSSEEAFSIIKKINIPISKEQFFTYFNQFDKDNNKELSREEFTRLTRELTQKLELKGVFQKYSKNFTDSVSLNYPIMDRSQFDQFIKKEQGEDELDPDSKMSVDAFFSEKGGEISFNDFTNLIFNQKNSIFKQDKLSQSQDMNQPLTDYYINSSHNTYLIANQLTGESNTQAYINAFKKGCRCIEIDAWDGSNEPIVTHGFTLTSSIKFRDIIKVVKECGFVWSKYPIIISIENHCGKENQKIMADILREILGNALYVIPSNYQSLNYFPSPNELKYKVIVKSKGNLEKIIQSLSTNQRKKAVLHYPVAHQSEEEICFQEQPSNLDQIDLNAIYYLERDNLDLQDEQLPPTFSLFPGSKLLRIPTKITLQTKSQLLRDQVTVVEEDEEDEDENDYPQYQVLEVKDFQKCISMVGVSFTKKILDGINLEAKLEHSTFDIFSLSEQKLDHLLKSKEQQLVQFHRQFFSRIYPKGSRVDSSNYDPLPGFISGSQIVALNFQTPDLPLFLYLSKFQQNGGVESGYILKPSFLRHPHDPSSVSSSHSKCRHSQNSQISKLPSYFQTTLFILTIEIISGQFLKSDLLEKATSNIFVEISIKGTQADSKNNKPQRTNLVQNNSFHPVFKPNTMTFNIYCPELAMVVFQVFNDGLISNDLISQFALDFTCIRSGYRVIPLWDKSLQPIPFSMLLGHITITPLSS